MVSTRLKNISQNGNLPQIGVKIIIFWNHHLEYWFLLNCEFIVWSCEWYRSLSYTRTLLPPPSTPLKSQVQVNQFSTLSWYQTHNYQTNHTTVRIISRNGPLKTTNKWLVSWIFLRKNIEQNLVLVVIWKKKTSETFPHKPLSTWFTIPFSNKCAQISSTYAPTWPWTMWRFFCENVVCKNFRFTR